MSLSPPTATAPTTAQPVARRAPRARIAERLREPRGLAWLAGLGLLVAGSAVLNTVRLAQNGYANVFYSAGVRSMLGSLHNFFFVSFDPGGLVSIDKPPLALWTQVLSAKVFGFTPLSLLLPEALMGVASVAILYVVIARRFGLLAGLAAGAALAVFPSFVAVSRANGVDPLLILLSLGACVAAIRACESGSWLSLLTASLLVGLAFNTKTLAAYLTIPAIAFGYLLCAPVSIPRRVLQLLAAGLLTAVVSFAWIAAVESTPASKRPYVGSSTNDTELGLTFEYNGFGRVEGQNGGPGQVFIKPGASVPKPEQLRLDRQIEGAKRIPPIEGSTRILPISKRDYAPSITANRSRKPVPFGGPPGVLRLFGKGLGEQGGWYLPFAFFGLLATLAMLWARALLARREPHPSANGRPPAAPAPPARWRLPSRSGGPAGRRARGAPALPPTGRRDPRLATALVLGGWFMTEAVVLSSSKGIVHPYYISAIAPGAAGMIGAGVASLGWLAGRRRPLVAPPAAVLLGAAAVIATVAVELVMMRREHYMRGFEPALVIGAGVMLVAFVVAAAFAHRRLAGIAIAVALAVLLIVPAGYASSTWLAPVESTFPAPGPTQTAGWGGVGVSERGLQETNAVIHYIRTHGGTRRFGLLTVSSDAAAPYILLGFDAAALGGYSGIDPALNGRSLAVLVKRREARYVMLGGQYSSRGGNGATKAVLSACRYIVPGEWGSPTIYPGGLVLFDCGGRERRLYAAR
ncbi:MAG: ArnT family glycosyltransferase [Solirubrobacteraceae bacterium]